MRVVVLGGGLFGLTAAAELRRRGHTVILHERDEIPSVRSSSYDVSKALRGGYGSLTPQYAPWVREARGRWAELEEESGFRFWHRTGCVQLATSFRSGAFEYESARHLSALGWPLQVWDPSELKRRQPLLAWPDVTAAVFDPWGGWLDAVAALRALKQRCHRLGVVMRECVRESPIAGRADADVVVVAVGPWLRALLPDLPVPVTLSRQHEALFRVPEPSPAEHLCPWSLDLAGAGWYGFPARDQALKVACHVPVAGGDPEGHRDGDPVQSDRAREFVERRFPTLFLGADEGRTCFYTLAPDSAFVVDEVPGRPGVFVAGCGGGHAFKFGPVLGTWVADRIEGRPVPEFLDLSRQRSGRTV